MLPGQCPPEALSSGHPTCRDCKKSMVLVAQVPAPLSTAHATIADRVLMVWACAAQPCATEVSSWRAFTCHLPGSATADSKTPEPAATSSMPHHTATNSPGAQQESAVAVADSSSAADHTWGASDENWGASDDTWGASQIDDGADLHGKDAFDFSDLDTALTQAVAHVPSKPYKQNDRDSSKSVQKQQQHQHRQPPASSCCATSDVAQRSLPGFYLHMTAEALGASASLSAEDQHIAELVAAYQDQTQQAGAPAAMEVSGDEWNGEVYEEDKEGAFHKFCQFVQRVPQQCVRYRMPDNGV